MLELDGSGSALGAPAVALARKWRPKIFADIVGQENAVSALTGALASGRLHHAFMFTGTRGIGKTTLARVLAKGFNCEQLADGEPCCQCHQCKQIDAGSHPDVIELDAASTTQVEAMRSLLETANYAPAEARHKVYIIDEVHMLSRHSFNAMLKTLEEPPAHVKFILATTDPQQVPATVQSRCLRFSLRRLPVELITGRLEHILKEEGITSEAGALKVIAEHADGSMRDALSILDEVLSSGEELSEKRVRRMVGAAGPGQVQELLAMLLDGDGDGLLERCSAMHEQALALDRVCSELAELLHQAQLAAISPDAGSQMHETVRRASSEWDAVSIQVAYELAIQGSRGISAASDVKSALEMTLLRILVLSKAQSKTRESEPAASRAGTRQAAQEPQAPQSAQPPKAAAKPAPPAAAPPKNRLPNSAEEWKGLCDILKGPAEALAGKCLFAGAEGSTLRLRLNEKDSSLLIQQEVLEKSLREKTGVADARLDINVGEGTEKELTPTEQKEKEQDREQEILKQRIEETAKDKGIMDSFPDARVVSAKEDKSQA